MSAAYVLNVAAVFRRVSAFRDAKESHSTVRTSRRRFVLAELGAALCAFYDERLATVRVDYQTRLHVASPFSRILQIKEPL